MGQKNASFSKEELDEYEELTYLTRTEILRAYARFEKLDPVRVARNKSSCRIPCEAVRELTEELRLNPYGDRICKVFSGSAEGMTFDDYLDMYSALSEAASREVKTAYAFRIYDFDGDGVVGKEDVRQLVERLIFDEDKHLTRSETASVIDQLLKEVDNDEDGALCFPEFQQAMNKSPDFLCNFKMYI